MHCEPSLLAVLRRFHEHRKTQYLSGGYEIGRLNRATDARPLRLFRTIRQAIKRRPPRSAKVWLNADDCKKSVAGVTK